MPRIIEGHLSAADMNIGIVVSRFNEFITRSLLDGALDALRRHGGDPDRVTVVWVPGAHEIAVAARSMAASGTYDALVCLGAVIRGATPHFDYIASGAAAGIAAVANETGVPTIFGVLTTDTIEQAIERAGTKAGNKGAEALLAAVEMVSVMRQL
ncbi:MAG: 6,7-dimethyl-8-ribityllumazine synthase [Bacteroidota bacterium]